MPPLASDLFVPRRQHAQRDLGAVAVERAGDEASALVAHGDDRAALRALRAAHVAAIDPQVAAAHALGSAPRDCDLSPTHKVRSGFIEA